MINRLKLDSLQKIILVGLLFDLCLHDDGNGFETSMIANVPAFYHLLFDYNMWKKADPDLTCCVYLNIRHLINKSARRLDNIAILRSLDAMEKLFLIVLDVTTPRRLTEICLAIIGWF